MWCYRTKTGIAGPVDNEQVYTLVEEGIISPDTPVQRDGTSEWLPAIETRIGVLFDDEPENDIQFTEQKSSIPEPRENSDPNEIKLRMLYRHVKSEFPHLPLAKSNVGEDIWVREMIRQQIENLEIAQKYFNVHTKLSSEIDNVCNNYTKWASSPEFSSNIYIYSKTYSVEQEKRYQER
ncbi:MAG: DUF4339 domain-containing protein, partial [Pseudomonadota bacterium]